MSERYQPLPLSELTAITPLDGRYRGRTAELAPYVSEYNLIRTRMQVEARYLVALSDVGVARRLSKDERNRLDNFGSSITVEDAQRVKETEEKTRHDVKAMELVFRSKVAGTSLEDLTEMIHFGLTSEDVNNIAYRLMLKSATTDVVIPVLDGLIDDLADKADATKSIPMLARTHGQGAVPTTVGKELIVFAVRLNKEVEELKRRELTGKLTGAVGNLNALQVAYPNVDWITFSKDFVWSFGLKPNLTSTQINPYEDIIAYSQNYQRINGILIDFDQDMWRYISDDWFVQEVRAGERGSSTMPQKVNPIDFENSEGNLEMANALFEQFSRKLAISRLQRDLSDSTIIRNIGTVLGYSLVGYKSVLTGLSRVRPNKEQMHQALDKDWTILSEAAQIIMRKEKVDDPYELMVRLTRGRHIGKEEWEKLVDELPISEKVKKQLRKLTPQNYIGLAVKITEMAIKEIKKSKKR